MSDGRKGDVPAVGNLRNHTETQKGGAPAATIDQTILAHARSCEIEAPPLQDPIERIRKILPSIIVYMHLGFTMASINIGLMKGLCTRDIKDQTLQKIVFSLIKEIHPQLRPRSIRKTELPEAVLQDPTAQAVLQVLQARIAGQRASPPVMPASPPPTSREQTDQIPLDVSDDDGTEKDWNSNQ